MLCTRVCEKVKFQITNKQPASSEEVNEKLKHSEPDICQRILWGFHGNKIYNRYKTTITMMSGHAIRI